MPNGNETSLSDCRFLGNEQLETLYATFIEAFSDYVYPFALTETQFRNHLNLTGVDMDRTLGCFDGDRMVGFSMNGFGDWDDIPTVYDAGTGVIPSMRRRGLSRKMFEHMIGIFSNDGIGQFLLEVINSNQPAIELYKNLGFNVVRELALLQCDGDINVDAPVAENIAVREILSPDWEQLGSFADGKPAWQNSLAALKRTAELKRTFGAYIEGRCVGFIIFSGEFGRVAQMAVEPNFRNRGVGTALLKQLQNETAPGFSLQVLNIDRSMPEAIAFFRKHGFYERLVQYEMILKL